MKKITAISDLSNSCQMLIHTINHGKGKYIVAFHIKFCWVIHSGYWWRPPNDNVVFCCCLHVECLPCTMKAKSPSGTTETNVAK